jgi:hypothetical protein
MVMAHWATHIGSVSQAQNRKKYSSHLGGKAAVESHTRPGSLSAGQEGQPKCGPGSRVGKAKQGDSYACSQKARAEVIAVMKKSLEFWTLKK